MCGYYDLVVACFPLTNPNNGAITCFLENSNGVPFYEDACSFTCNTGFLLTGSNFRMCQSNTKWSGTEPICKRGR